MVRKRKKSKSYCKLCNKQTVRTGYKYCSNVCQQEYQYCQFIEKWKQGKENGLRNIGVVSRYVKKYLRRKYYNKCCLCGWSKVNPKSGLVPLVADHIDGDWRNNSEKNLRLICPNCDALNPTYAALNKGNGRKNRKATKRPITKGRLNNY